MYCDECKARPTTVRIETTVNGVRISKDLCNECTMKLAQNIGTPISLNSFFSNFFFPVNKEFASDQVCQNCGMSAAEFESSGLLGCRQCYTNLSNVANPIIKQLQKGTEHIGRIPVGLENLAPNNINDTQDLPKDIQENNSEIVRLQNDLDKAIIAENFESAAIIRDKIKEFNELNKNSASGNA